MREVGLIFFLRVQGLLVWFQWLVAVLLGGARNSYSYVHRVHLGYMGIQAQSLDALGSI